MISYPGVSLEKLIGSLNKRIKMEEKKLLLKVPLEKGRGNKILIF